MPALTLVFTMIEHPDAKGFLRGWEKQGVIAINNFIDVAFKVVCSMQSSPKAYLAILGLQLVYSPDNSHIDVVCCNL